MTRSTDKQKGKLRFIEEALSIKFEGYISNYLDCQLFIDEFYDDALYNFEEAKEAYYGEFDY